MEIIPPNLTNYQKEIIFSEKRFTVTLAAPKTGKTFSHICWLFGIAHEIQKKNNANYWWIAPVYSQAEIAFYRIKNYLFGRKDYKFNESKLMIQTPMKTNLVFKSADNSDNLYGEDVYGAVFDEFTRAKPEAWVALRTTLSSTNGKCKLIGNYLGVSNWGHHFIDKIKDNDEYETFKITVQQAIDENIIKQEEIESIKNDPQITENIYRMLYMLEDGDSPDQLIKNENIDSLFYNTHVKDGDKYLTCDIALHGSDRFVIVMWDGFIIDKIWTIEKIDAKQAVEKINNIKNEYQIKENNIIFDSDGIGNYLKGYLPRAIPFNNNGSPIKDSSHIMEYKNLKSQCYFNLADRINRGGIYIKCEVNRHQLYEELKTIKNANIDKDGKLSVLPKDEVKKIIGRSPDIADAIMMREWFEVKRRVNKVIYSNV